MDNIEKIIGAAVPYGPIEMAQELMHQPTGAIEPTGIDWPKIKNISFVAVCVAVVVGVVYFIYKLEKYTATPPPPVEKQPADAENKPG